MVKTGINKGYKKLSSSQKAAISGLSKRSYEERENKKKRKRYSNVEPLAQKTVKGIEEGSIRNKEGFFLVDGEVAAGKKTADLLVESKQQERKKIQETRYKNKVVSHYENKKKESQAYKNQSIYHKKENKPKTLYKNYSDDGITGYTPISKNKSSFSDAGYKYLKREKNHYKRMENINEQSNKVTTFGGNLLKVGFSSLFGPKQKITAQTNLILNKKQDYNAKSFIGKVGEKTYSSLIGVIPNLINTVDKAYITGRGLVGNNKQTWNEVKPSNVLSKKEFWAAYGETKTVFGKKVFIPFSTPESFVTGIFAVTGAASYTSLKAPSIKAKYQSKLTGGYKKTGYTTPKDTTTNFIPLKLEKTYLNKFGVEQKQYLTVKTKVIEKGFDVVDIKAGKGKYFNPYYQTLKQRQTTLTGKNIDLIGNYKTSYKPSWHIQKSKMLGQLDLGVYKFSNPLPIKTRNTIKSYGTLEQGKPSYYNYYQRSIKEYSFNSKGGKIITPYSNTKGYYSAPYLLKIFKHKGGSIGGYKSISKQKFTRYKNNYKTNSFNKEFSIFKSTPTIKPINIFSLGLYPQISDLNKNQKSKNKKKRRLNFSPFMKENTLMDIKPAQNFDIFIKPVLMRELKSKEKIQQKPKQKQLLKQNIIFPNYPDEFNKFDNNFKRIKPKEPKKPKLILDLDLNFFENSSTTKRKKGSKRKFDYRPDVRSIFLGITSSKKQKADFTGLEARPMINTGFKGVNLI